MSIQYFLQMLILELDVQQLLQLLFDGLNVVCHAMEVVMKMFNHIISS